MCTFISELPKVSNSVSLPKKQNIQIFLKPTEEKEFYRFRLLNYKSKKTDRDYPFIELFKHVHWGKTEDGKPTIDDQVICPVSKHVHWEGDPYKDCPICKFANNGFVQFRESGWKDKDANKKSKEFGRKFEALIPVFCINDPTYDGNNGKLKVFSFSDKKVYKQFKELINETLSKGTMVFNGTNAVDFLIRLEKVTETVNEGTPKEYTWSHSVVKQMGFTKTPHDIPGITAEAIDKFEFDDQFYVSSTMEELKAFYKKHCTYAMDDIDEEEIALVSTPAPEKQEVKKTNEVKKSVETPHVEEKPKEEPKEELDLDEIADIEPEKKEAPSEEPLKKEVVEEKVELPVEEVEVPKVEKKSADDISIDNIDDFINNL